MSEGEKKQITDSRDCCGMAVVPFNNIKMCSFL